MAQLITASTAVLNDGAVVTPYAAQDTNYVDFGAAKGDGQIVIIVKNTNDSVAKNTATITVAPGASGLAWQKDLGTLTEEIADGNVKKVIGPLESARFIGTNGYVTIGVAVTQSGTVSSVEIEVIELPKA